MKKYWDLFWHFRKIQLMRMMEYRGDFIFWSFVSLMWTLFNFFFYALIIGGNKSIVGWSYDEIMVLLSFFTMVDAFTWSIFYPNMNDYVQSIYDGSLSKLLILPINSVFVILNQRTTYNNIPRFFVGLFILIYSLNKLDIQPSLFSILLATILFITSLIFLYSGWFILSTLSLWVEKLQNINEIMPGLRSFYQMPVKIYTGLTGAILTFILPLGLITTLPSEIILNKGNNWLLIIYFIIFTIFFAKLALFFYHYSIKKYISVGG